jgi:hypothetical protein
MPLDLRCVTSLNPNSPANLLITGITPKVDAVVAKTENQKLTGDAAETKTESSEVAPPAPDDSNSNVLFAAVTNLNDHLTTLHATLPPRTALLLFSGHSDPRSMSTLAARRAEYQASQQGKESGLCGGCGGN